MPEPRGGRPSGLLHDIRSLTSYPPLMRRGFANVLTPAFVQVGSNWFYRIPAEYWTRLVSLAFQFTNSATSGEREYFVGYYQGDGTLFAAVPVSEAFGGSFSGQCVAAIDGPALTVAGGNGISTEGRQLGPAALTTLCSATLTQGEWAINWEVQLDGTVAAAELNNFGLYIGGTLLAQSENPPTAGGPYSQESVVIQVGVGGATVSIKNIGAGTSTAGYTGEFTAQPYGAAVAYSKLPDIVMQPGWEIGIGANNAQSGDTVSGVVMLAEQYPSDWASGTEDRNTEDLLRELFERAYAG